MILHSTLGGKIILLAIAIMFGMTTIVLAEPIMLTSIEINIGEHFNNWQDDPYVIHVHDCTEMASECEEYFETFYGWDCYFIYGHKEDDNGSITVAHKWNIVKINNKWYEFESTCLNFQKTSEKYIVDSIQHGFYVDGVKQNKTQNFDDWENFFKGKINL